MQFYENYANQKNWWRLAPRNEEGGVWWDYTTAGWFLFREKYEKTFFVNQSTMHHCYGAWRPIGCCQAVPAVPGTQKFSEHLRTLFQSLQF